MQKVAWFNDLLTFSQQWKDLPFSDLSNYFFDKEQSRLPIIQVGEEPKRISCLSVFQSGIQPMWEDKVNATGSELKIQFSPPHGQGFKYLNELWENLMNDLVTGNIPHASEIAGLRFCDKSKFGETTLRVEVWLKFTNPQKDQRGIDISTFILKHHFEKTHPNI